MCLFYLFLSAAGCFPARRKLSRISLYMKRKQKKRGETVFPAGTDPAWPAVGKPLCFCRLAVMPRPTVRRLFPDGATLPCAIAAAFRLPPRFSPSLGRFSVASLLSLRLLSCRFLCLFTVAFTVAFFALCRRSCHRSCRRFLPPLLCLLAAAPMLSPDLSFFFFAVFPYPPRPHFCRSAFLPSGSPLLRPPHQKSVPAAVETAAGVYTLQSGLISGRRSGRDQVFFGGGQMGVGSSVRHSR